ncbi:hypothetical protein CCP3SC1AL1_3440006 [Gammaproteobacteria bacterium]
MKHSKEYNEKLELLYLEIMKHHKVTREEAQNMCADVAIKLMPKFYNVQITF